MIEKFKSIEDINSKTMPKNDIIVNNYTKAYFFINSPRYKKIMCSISGGSDSDIVLDICYRCDKDKKIEYVWFDTGLEYQATKEHICYLENKYNIEIKRIRAIKPIPVTCKEFGQPFLSKFVSDMMSRLQKHNFMWENDTYENLIEKYPDCKGAIAWWTNHRDVTSYGYSMFNINYNKWLKEFILENPPTFKISDKCCKYAKKEVSKRYIKENKNDLIIMGIRKAEGGIRKAQYKSCFIEDWETDKYMPVFWYSDKDKEEYEKHFNIQHSRCYTEYGFKRTGCACCPFGFYGGLKEELNNTRQYEPKLHKAVCNVFHDSYEYSKQFEKFKKKMKNK